MRFDIDSYREILDTITRNKSRSLLTGFGVFWGVFMLVALIGGGEGLKEKLQKNFEGFATNTAMIWAQKTTQPYKGFRTGRSWNMDVRDVDRLRHRVSELDVVTPMLFSGQKKLSYQDKSINASVQGVLPDYKEISVPKLLYGRFINEMDIAQRRKVCILGKRIYRNLFNEGENPCGKRVRIDSTYYNIVGVDYRSGEGINFGGDSEEMVTLPQSTLRAVYNRGNTVDLMAVTGRKGVAMSSLVPKMRETLAMAHQIDPADEAGIMCFNAEAIFKLMDNLFMGVNFLIWLIGIGTLLAGAIGVSNIMMITVKERTTEIGIRRAIGATPKMILSQIMSESILLTIVAGMSGILVAVGVLQIAEWANSTDGIVNAHFQVGFWTAVFSAALLCLLGGLAGLAPAWRAMSIKPVDAMRDE